MYCGKNVRLKPRKIVMAASLAHRSGVHAAGDLGPPVMQPAHVGHHHAADHDVVEMRHDEVRVSAGGRPRASAARNSPVSPPIVNRPMKPNAYEHRCIERDRALVERGRPVKHLDR